MASTRTSSSTTSRTRHSRDRMRSSTRRSPIFRARSRRIRYLCRRRLRIRTSRSRPRCRRATRRPALQNGMTRNDERAFVLFATYGAQPGLTEDDQHFSRALERRGVEVCAAAWDDPAAAWSNAAAVVIRSTWDYHLRRADFLEWVRRVSAATTLYNNAWAVQWNSHKGYLAEIARRGVPVIDTVFASAQSNLDLTAVAREHGWRDVVVK